MRVRPVDEPEVRVSSVGMLLGNIFWAGIVGGVMGVRRCGVHGACTRQTARKRAEAH